MLGTTVGEVLRSWRKTRRWSQMDLALEADISTRHLSFVETGRSQASRAMLLTLGRALDMPLREQNRLLVAGGFAAVHQETSMSAPQLEEVQRALSMLLKSMQPAPAYAVDRHWNILLSNEAGTQIFGLLGIDPAEVCPSGQPNALRLLFHPAGLRPHIVNWDEVADATLARLRRDMVGPPDEAMAALLTMLEALDGRSPPSKRDAAPHVPLLIPMRIRVGEHVLSFFTTITTIGTPTDVTLQELRIETLLPADAVTTAWLQAATVPHEIKLDPDDGPAAPVH